MLFGKIKREMQAREDAVDAEMKRLRTDLETKAKKRIAEMGTKWVLHPDHSPKNLNLGPNTLGFKSV